jgi:hypothetical protein
VTEPFFKSERGSQRAQQSKGPDIGPFTKIPSKFFASGTAAMLGSSASLLYLALCEHVNRNGKLEFGASDKALASETGLSPRTISDARKKLVEKKLISCIRDKGSSFRYTMLKLSLSWVKLKDRIRPKDKPRGSAAQANGYTESKGEEGLLGGAEDFAAPESSLTSRSSPIQPRNSPDLREWKKESQRADLSDRTQPEEFIHAELRDLGRELFEDPSFGFGWNQN